MGNYDFRTDLQQSKKCHLELRKKVKKSFKNAGISISFLKEMFDFSCDDVFLLSGREVRFEYKEDFKCNETGNIAVEYFSRDNPSGISITKSDFYIYRVHFNNKIYDLMMTTEMLRDLIKNKKYHTNHTDGGDLGSNTKNFLFYFDDIFNVSWDISNV